MKTITLQCGDHDPQQGRQTLNSQTQILDLGPGLSSFQSGARRQSLIFSHTWDHSLDHTWVPIELSLRSSLRLLITESFWATALKRPLL